MNSSSNTGVSSSVETACRRIPPLFPLDSFVAVNPFLGLADRSFRDACQLLRRTGGGVPLLSPREYLELYDTGVIRPEHLAEAGGAEWPAPELVQLLKGADSVEAGPRIMTVADVIDAERPRSRWAPFVVEEISKWCGVLLDENQTTWRAPELHGGLYRSWLASARHDFNSEAFGIPGFRAYVAALPEGASQATEQILRELRVGSAEAADFLHCELQTVSGWAAYAQYLSRRTPSLPGGTTPLQDLLAIRLAYDGALFAAFGNDNVVRANWRNRTVAPAASKLLDALCVWQCAYEIGYQRKLAYQLVSTPRVNSVTRPTFQAVFCIDVRSEVMRRALEAAERESQTIGFAGFFGFAVSHRSGVSDGVSARCPVLLTPNVNSRETGRDDKEADALVRRSAAGVWKAFQNSVSSCFSFVETIGLGFSLPLLQRHVPPSCRRAAPPEIVGCDLPTRVALAEGALRNMGLIRGFARLVLFCGHGTESPNNPHAAGLNCGACGGKAGDVNARLAAATLNDPLVREALRERAINLPTDTVFVAGLHDTATDEVTLFDLERVPDSHAHDLKRLQTALAKAGRAARRERARLLKMDIPTDDKLSRAFRDRASDIAQLRPEWGLANNAAFIAAPRDRTSPLPLEGRVFLHDYDATQDPENRILSLILSAPVVVASWINLQYYASRVSPQHYGAGNKLLHNVCGGIGVFEGNGGDLRTGLPLQSLHDGERFVHEPRRLSVFVEASPDAIDSVLRAHRSVEALFNHGWIHLFAINEEKVYRRTDGSWDEFESAEPSLSGRAPLAADR